MKVASFSDYKQVRKMSFNDFNRWVVALYQAAYEDGLNEQSSSDDVAAILTEDRLREILLSIKGVGEKRVEQIIDAILEEGVSDGTVPNN